MKLNGPVPFLYFFCAKDKKNGTAVHYLTVVHQQFSFISTVANFSHHFFFVWLSLVLLEENSQACSIGNIYRSLHTDARQEFA